MHLQAFTHKTTAGWEDKEERARWKSQLSAALDIARQQAILEHSQEQDAGQNVDMDIIREEMIEQPIQAAQDEETVVLVEDERPVYEYRAPRKRKRYVPFE
jgi:hypothetical protein